MKQYILTLIVMSFLAACATTDGTTPTNQISNNESVVTDSIDSEVIKPETQQLLDSRLITSASLSTPETRPRATSIQKLRIQATTDEVQSRVNLDPNDTHVFDANCPAGWFATGGGYSILPIFLKNVTATTASVRELYRPQVPNSVMGYRVLVKNNYDRAQEVVVTVRATCINPRG